MIEVRKIQPVVPDEAQLQSYVTIVNKLTTELENVTRQLKNATSRIHVVSEELNQLRRRLKGKTNADEL